VLLPLPHRERGGKGAGPYTPLPWRDERSAFLAEPMVEGEGEGEGCRTTLDGRFLLAKLDLCTSGALGQ